MGEAGPTILIYRISVDIFGTDRAAYDFLQGHNKIVSQIANYKIIKEFTDPTGTMFVMMQRINKL